MYLGFDESYVTLHWRTNQKFKTFHESLLHTSIIGNNSNKSNQNVFLLFVEVCKISTLLLFPLLQK